MSLLLAALLVSGQVSWDPGEFSDAFLIWGQSTCGGLDSGAPSGETSNAYGNKSPLEYHYIQVAALTQLSAWPLHDTTDNMVCMQPLGGRLYSACSGSPGSYTGPRKQLQDYFSVATGKKSIVGITAVPGVPYDLYFDWSDSGNYQRYSTAPFFEMVGARYPSARVQAVFTCHGEADYNKTAAVYAGYMADLKTDMNFEVKRRVANNVGYDMPIFASQYSSCSYVGACYASTLSCGAIQGIVDAANAGDVVFVGTTYQYTHASGPHMSTASNKMRGAKYMEAYLWGPSWTGVRTNASGAGKVERVGNAYRLNYHVQFPPLVFDTTLVSAIGDNGFLYMEETAGPTYTTKQINAPEICTGAGTPNAACQNANQIIITPTVAPNLSAVSRGLYYGSGCWYNAGTNVLFNDTQCISPGSVCVTPGPTTGQRGNLRDSDPATWNATPMYNWAAIERWDALP